MGAIIWLRKMPETCRDCPLADKENELCRIRGNSRIIAMKQRSNRMPMCPLENEGKYLTRIAKYLRGLLA